MRHKKEKIMLKKTLSIVALLTMVTGCQYDTPVRTWNSPEASQSSSEGQDYSSEQMPSESISSGSSTSGQGYSSEQMPSENNSTLKMHPSVMGDQLN